MNRRGPDDAVAPLWRAAQAYRLLTVVYALGFQIAVNGDLAHPAFGAAVFAVVAVSSGVFAAVYLLDNGRDVGWVIAELVLTCALMLSTLLIASEQWRADNQSLPTTLWATNAVISVAILTGPVFGGVAAAAVIVSSTVVKGFVNIDLGRNAAVVILLAVGVIIGMGAVTARRASARLAEATRLAAATDERERLSRHVHDGVLQVLALIARRGREIGGPTEDLAYLAADQERVLRSLLSAPGVPDSTGTTSDVATMLRTRESDRVTVSTPGQPVTLDSVVAAELSAAVDNALDNAARHAGPGARVFVLLEDLGESVVVSVRDDGVGIAPGRVAAAAASGRLGIAQSIVGRVESLGGRAVLDSAPGAGTEWELTVPRPAHDGTRDR
ncbi:DUF5931 domain-containing protein [Williamsia herbipolensis]|uniref:DUF5931 domain-containing protein n=1 Tax=Williamsia herbipolensis TaxID=1603258 RepID=A0AAU4JWW3_9NOCA|nr:DUF5931 domain-containing protein [Williamsia herbipolensis]